CLPAIWNGFPLVYSDTGAYLATAFEGQVPLARPTGYGLFIRWTSLGGNVWLPLVAQSLLFSWLLLRTVRVVLPENARLGHAVAMAVTVGLTGMGWYASQLMPDIFAGLVVLGFFVLLFDADLGWLGKGAVAIAMYIFCFSHYSHAALLLGLAGAMAAFALLQRLRRRKLSFGIDRIAWALVPALLAVLTFFSVNHVNGFGWRMTRSSHVFTMARLSETGLLRDYLHETCPEKQWPLCPYADSLPGTAAEFIWNDDSPFKRTGYWENSREGYDSLLTDFFRRGNFVKGYLKEACKAGYAQLFALSVGEGVTPYNESSSPYKFFERAMPDQIGPYLASEQFEREFSFEWEKKILWVTMAVSVLLILGIWILGGRGLPSKWVWLSVIACAGYVMNAILTGALANVYSRLQSRVAWLIPLAVCLYVVSFLRKRQS
ncbi:MAG TPA: hypothetical protein VHS96_15005, partial [Bacteroidia bacterium]|nr:hypothetical protein [Bacteroidia bacterium]